MVKNKSTLKSSAQNELPAIKEESSTMRLSSDSIDNEKENVSKYMNYTYRYFAYLRIGQQSGAIRFYPDADTAYTATIKEAETLLQKGISGSRTSFVISDSNQNVIYDGEPKKNGKIHFTIYDGKHIEKTISITATNNTKFKEKKIMKQIKNLTKTTSVTNNQESLDKNKYARKINANAKDFITKGILTPKNVEFLCLSKESAHKIARLVQETAIKNKDADADKFVKAIQDASLGMVTITKKLASGKATDEKHCSMHDDLLYCVAHCKSYDSLFDGSKGWRKTPGKLDYNKLEDAIVDMYEKGQDKLLKQSQQQPKSKVNADAALPTLDSSVVGKTPKERSEQNSIDTIVKAISSTIMTYMTSSEDTLFYLRMKGLSLESEVKSQTNNVISVSLNGKSVIFKTLSGASKELKIKTRTDVVELKREVQTIVSQLIVCAAVSSKTRDLIADVVNLDTVETFVTTSFNIAA